ncbi:MAG: hypothetical protein OXD42_12625, partial [Rhodospirillaceae bacterium]|nr:hypothetical protein [Rhodospirillaceae bacterium]
MGTDRPHAFYGFRIPRPALAFFVWSINDLALFDQFTTFLTVVFVRVAPITEIGPGQSHGMV